MRLVLLFSNIKRNFFRDDDIVLSTKSFLDKSVFEGKKYSIQDFDFDDEGYLDLLVQKNEVIYQSFSTNKYLINAYKGGFSNFYNHIYTICCKWKSAINELLIKYPINEVVFSDLINHNSYIPYYEAEGEIQKQLFYKSYDFIPKLLYDYLLVLDKNINLIILRKRYRITLLFRIFIRRYCLIHLKLFLLIFERVKHNLSSSKKKNIYRRKPKFIFLSRGIAHTHYMFPFVSSYNKDAVLFVSDGYYQKGKNLAFCQAQPKFNYVNALNYIYIQDLFSEYIILVKTLVRIILKGKENLQIAGLNFNINSFAKEQLIHWFDSRVYARTVKRYLEAQDLKERVLLITGEMITAFPLGIHNLSKELGLKSIQLQTSVLMYKPQGDFVHCDKYLFKSLKDLDYFRKDKYLSADKLDYWGGTSSISDFKYNDGINSIIYFSQPYENDHEVKLVSYISKYLLESNINLYIKLHPRDTKEKFIGIENLKFISETLNLTDYIKDFQLAILRTSSIARDIMVAGVPIIFCLTSLSLHKTKAGYLDRNYSGTVFDFPQILERIANYQRLQKDFQHFRIEYFKNEKEQTQLAASLTTFLEEN